MDRRKLKKIIDRIVHGLVVAVLIAAVLWMVAYSVLRNGWKGEVCLVGGQTISIESTDGSIGHFRVANAQSYKPGDQVSVLELFGKSIITRLD